MERNDDVVLTPEENGATKEIDMKGETVKNLKQDKNNGNEWAFNVAGHKGTIREGSGAMTLTLRAPEGKGSAGGWYYIDVNKDGISAPSAVGLPRDVAEQIVMDVFMALCFNGNEKPLSQDNELAKKFAESMPFDLKYDQWFQGVERGKNPLALVAMTGNEDAFKIMVDRGGNADQKGPDGLTPRQHYEGRKEWENMSVGHQGEPVKEFLVKNGERITEADKAPIHNLTRGHESR